MECASALSSDKLVEVEALISRLMLASDASILVPLFAKSHGEFEARGETSLQSFFNVGRELSSCDCGILYCTKEGMNKDKYDELKI